MYRPRIHGWMGTGLTLLLILAAPLSVFPTNGGSADGTIDFIAVNADVTQILFFFAAYGRFNIVVDPGVSGTVTVRLSNVEPETAFDIVLELAGLSAYSVDGALFVTRKNR